MKRIVFVLCLAACSKHPAKEPVLAEIDRTCTQNTDCTLATPRQCCTLCDTPEPQAVNASAWMKANEGVEDRCKGVQCPQAMCPKGPACRDEFSAVCTAGRCELARTPNEACAKTGRTPDQGCITAGDCVMFTMQDDCCDHCGGRPMNKAAATRARAALEKKCAGSPHSCPPIDCPAQPVDCVDNQCVVKP